METEPYNPIDWHNRKVEREYWLMNWIHGAVVVNPIQADIFYNGLGPYLFRKYPAARYYDPADELLEIVNALAKIKYGDRGSVMSFVNRYGLLHRSALIN